VSFISLLFGLGGQQSTLGTLTLDVLLNEETRLTSNVSKYPVEDGSPPSDNITIENEGLSITGKVTGAGVLFFQGLGPSKLIAAKATLRQLYLARTPITVITGGDVYENMAIVDLNLTRNNSGEALLIDAQLQQIRKVILRRADLPPQKTKVPAKAGATKTNAGKVSSDVNQPTGVIKQSTLDGLIFGKTQTPDTGAAP
jgi:hypothetical protein